MKKSLRLAVLLVPLLVTTSFAGIYYEQEITIPGRSTMSEGFARVVYVYISGAKMRVEMRGPSGNAVKIQRYDQGKMYQLYPDNKLYMEVPVLKPTPEEEAQVLFAATKSDETKKIGDYNCTRYELITKGLPGLPAEGMTTQFWMTTDVDVVDEFAKFAEAQGRSQSTKQATEMAKIKGFPILVEVNSPPTKGLPAGKMTLTTTTVRKQDIPDSMFEVPADYTKVEAPPPGATPPAAPPAAPAQGGAGAGKGE